MQSAHRPDNKESRVRGDWARGLIADQRVRFLVVGAFNTGFAYALFVGLFLAFAHAVHYLLLLTLGHLTSTLVAFVLHRRLVFRVSGPWWGDLHRYLLVNGLMLLLNLVVLPLLVLVSPAGPLAAQAVFVVVVVVVSYLGHKHFSFRRRSDNYGKEVGLADR